MRPISYLATAVVTAALLPASAAAESPDAYYSTKQPYFPQASLDSYSTPPAGFHQIYTSSVNRHGSRGLSGWKYDDLADQMLQTAADADQLTDLGWRLIPQVEAMHQANLELTGPNGATGYGNLTTFGRAELRGIGERNAARNEAVLADGSISVTSSGEDRATESAQYFIEGLRDYGVHVEGPVTATPELLYAHKDEESPGYERYAQWKDSDILEEKVAEAYSLPAAREASISLLSQIFRPDFIRQLDEGTLSFQGREKESKTVEGIVDAALQFYNLYIIAPAMDEEAAKPAEGWIFHEYMDDKIGPTLSYLLDVEDFYEKGPAIAEETVSYDNFSPLLDDILRGMRDRANGGDVAAEYRFGHAETIIPLAALLRLPGSERGVPANELMTQDNSPWRGDEVSPMAANIQWDAFQDEQDQTIVRMLYNEKEIPFHAGCVPISAQSNFYTLDELEACLPLGSKSDHSDARLRQTNLPHDSLPPTTGHSPSSFSAQLFDSTSSRP